jgi:hypothetical protein
MVENKKVEMEQLAKSYKRGVKYVFGGSMDNGEDSWFVLNEGGYQAGTGAHSFFITPPPEEEGRAHMAELGVMFGIHPTTEE